MLVYLQIIDNPQERVKLETVYRQYQQLMYAVALKILGNPQDAEDAVHNAFVKIAKNINKIVDPECPKTKSYIVTIVEHQSIDLYRKKKRRPQEPLNEATAGLTVVYNGENELARCMAKLPARYRQILLLKYHHGYTTREIAKMLDLSLSNASKLEQRAKAKLEKLCKEAELL